MNSIYASAPYTLLKLDKSRFKRVPRGVTTGFDC